MREYDVNIASLDVYYHIFVFFFVFFFFQAEDGIRDGTVTGVQTCALPISTLPEAERRLAGSALKFCLLAAGEADLYPRFGPTAEWDTAAGQAVLEAR